MISYGSANINYNTPLFEVMAQRIRENALMPDDGYASVMEQARAATRQEVERCFRMWG